MTAHGASAALKAHADDLAATAVVIRTNLQSLAPVADELVRASRALLRARAVIVDLARAAGHALDECEGTAAYAPLAAALAALDAMTHEECVSDEDLRIEAEQAAEAWLSATARKAGRHGVSVEQESMMRLGFEAGVLFAMTGATA